MRVPLSWLRDCVDLDGVNVADVADALITAGVEVQRVDDVGADVEGPLVFGEVLAEARDAAPPGARRTVAVGDHGHIDVALDGPGGTGPVAHDRVVVALPG